MEEIATNSLSTVLVATPSKCPHHLGDEERHYETLALKLRLSSPFLFLKISCIFYNSDISAGDISTYILNQNLLEGYYHVSKFWVKHISSSDFIGMRIITAHRFQLQVVPHHKAITEQLEDLCPVMMS